MRDDLTLDQIFSDPLIATLMRADRVDADALRKAWSTTPFRARPPAQPFSVPSPRPAPGLDALVSDCLQAMRAGQAGQAGAGRSDRTAG